MSNFKRIFGHNQAEIFPIKPLPPIFLGPPTHNGAIEARVVAPGVYVPPVGVDLYITPPPPVFEAPPLPPPQKGTVWGIITDCQTGAPLQGAKVVLDGSNTSTNALGKYEFVDIEPGRFSLYVYKE